VVLTGRNNNEIYIDLKNAKAMPKSLVDGVERELPRALKMLPASDVINLSIQATAMSEIDRHDTSDHLMQDVLAKQADLENDIKHVRALNGAKDKEIARLSGLLAEPVAKGK
jgi:hypothetical protein